MASRLSLVIFCCEISWNLFQTSFKISEFNKEYSTIFETEVKKHVRVLYLLISQKKIASLIMEDIRAKNE